jgi:hypothetical protein
MTIPVPVKRTGLRAIPRDVWIIGLVTAFGFFDLVSGVALLPASGIAGLHWYWTGPSPTFICGAAFAVLTLSAVIGTIRPSANPGR